MTEGVKKLTTSTPPDIRPLEIRCNSESLKGTLHCTVTSTSNILKISLICCPPTCKCFKNGRCVWPTLQFKSRPIFDSVYNVNGICFSTAVANMFALSKSHFLNFDLCNQTKYSTVESCIVLLHIRYNLSYVR